MFALSFKGAPAPEPLEVPTESFINDDRNVLTCGLCNTIVEDVVILLENGTTSDQQIIDYIIDTCVRLNIFANPDQVCGGMAAIALVSIDLILNCFITTLAVLLCWVVEYFIYFSQRLNTSIAVV